MEVITSFSLGEWESYLDNSGETTFYHQLGWRNVIEKTFGHKSLYLMAREGYKSVGILPLFLVKSHIFANALVSVPFANYGGIISEDSQAEASLIHAAQEKAKEFEVSYVELRHLFRNISTLPTKLSKVTMLLELESEVEAMWRKIGPKVRNQVRKAQKSNLTVVQGVEFLPEFYAVFAENMRDLGTPVHSPVFFENMALEFPKEINFVVIRLNGKPIGAACTVYFRETLEVPFASTLRRYNYLCPNMLLYWELIKIAIENKCRTFDFGRSTKNAATYKFKEQWGAQPKQLFYQFILPGQDMPNLSPENPKYKLFINAWKRMPLSIANILGPYLIKNIP